MRINRQLMDQTCDNLEEAWQHEEELIKKIRKETDKTQERAYKRDLKTVHQAIKQYDNVLIRFYKKVRSELVF